MQRVHDRLDETYKMIGEFMAKELNPLIDRIKALEEKSVDFAGTWKSGQSYERAIVSFRGGLWLSKMPNNATRPGEGPAWRLAVKSGDGK